MGVMTSSLAPGEYAFLERERFAVCFCGIANTTPTPCRRCGFGLRNGQTVRDWKEQRARQRREWAQARRAWKAKQAAEEAYWNSPAYRRKMERAAAKQAEAERRENEHYEAVQQVHAEAAWKRHEERVRALGGD